MYTLRLVVAYGRIALLFNYQARVGEVLGCVSMATLEEAAVAHHGTNVLGVFIFFVFY